MLSPITAVIATSVCAAGFPQEAAKPSSKTDCEKAKMKGTRRPARGYPGLEQLVLRGEPSP